MSVWHQPGQAELTVTEERRSATTNKRSKMAMSSKSMTMGSQANTDTVCVSVTDFHPWLLVLRECATAAHTRPSTCHTRWETNHACAHPQRSENLCDTPQASGRADQRIKKKKKKKKKEQRMK
jgi:hypothetical protein